MFDEHGPWQHVQNGEVRDRRGVACPCKHVDGVCDCESAKERMSTAQMEGTREEITHPTRG